MPITIEVYGHATTFEVTPKQLRKLAAKALRSMVMDELAHDPTNREDFDAISKAFRAVRNKV